jgi:REJ domain
VPEGALAVGSYSFSLTMTKGSRQATTSTLIQVVQGQPPTVSISGVVSVVNPGDKLSLLGAAQTQSGHTASFSWSVTNGGVDVTSSVLLSSRSSRYLLTQSGTLNPGDTYVVRLTATDPVTQVSAFSEVSTTVNIPPQPGIFTVSPTTGTVG